MNYLLRALVTNRGFFFAYSVPAGGGGARSVPGVSVTGRLSLALRASNSRYRCSN